jgi:hypothetical protein
MRLCAQESWTDAPGDSHIHAMYGHIDEVRACNAARTRSPVSCALCVATQFLYKYIGGIQPAGPAGDMWARVVFAPQVDLKVRARFVLCLL